MVLFGAFSLASAYSTNVDQLLVLRFLTGLGLGAGMPNATTLLSEYTPERHKSLLVTSMFCGFNLGMAGGGFILAKLIPAFGWHSLLLIGGILPLILSVVLLFWLPESARYLVVRNRGTDKVRKTLAPIDPTIVAQASSFSVPEQKTVKARNVFAVIFSGTYSTGTLLLWLTYFMGLVIVYLLTSWLPTLMRDSGASMEQAAFIGALFQFGGVLSAVAVGWAMDRFNPHKVIGIFYLLAGVFAYAVGQSLGNITPVGDVGAGGGHVRQRCAIGDAFLGSAVLSDTRAGDRGVVDARDWPVWRDSRGMDGRDAARVGLEFRAGADGAGDPGGVGHHGGGDQGHGQSCGCDLRG